jgi:hypothetical protein
VRMTTQDDRGDPSSWYGELEGISEHQLVEGGDTMVFAEVSWLEGVDLAFAGGHLPKVRRNPRMRLNQEVKHRIVPLHHILSQHVVYYPFDSRKWRENGVLAAVFRRAEIKRTR